MVSHEGCSINKSPVFTIQTMSSTKVLMKAYLMSLGVNVWVFVMVGYVEPKEMTSDKDAKL